MLRPHRESLALASPQRTAPPPSPSPSPPPSPPHPTTALGPIGSPMGSPMMSLQKPSKHTKNNNKILKRMRSVFRSFPIVSPTCRIPISSRLNDGGSRITGTLFGHRKARVNLAIQENPRCLPMLLLELAIPTGKLLQDMGMGLVRIALECEKHHPSESKTKLIEEPIWTMYCNGRKTGYGIKRQPTDDDLSVMQLLHAVSMGAGVLPTSFSNGGGGGGGGDANIDHFSNPTDGELTYMRAFFERVVGSRDSETYYMMNPDGSSGPELSVFFVRV